MTRARLWRGVFFDLDGTLADTVELILMSYRHTMRTHLGESPSDDRWLETIGRPLVTQLKDFARDDAEADAMLATYTTFQSRIHDDMVNPFPGAGSVLGALRQRGSRVAVVTSKRSAIARRTLEVCDLLGSVDLLVAADHVERGKPDPESVLHALHVLELGACANEVVFVGDSPFDLRAGRAAGTRTAAVSWGPFARSALEAEEPDYFLETLEDVLALA